MAFPSFALKVPSPTAHSDVWRGDELASAEARVVSTGHVALDAQLPGGGWPIGALTEVLQAVPEAQVWQLLLPALVLTVRLRGGRVVLVGAPKVPFAPALAAAGLPTETLLWVRGDTAVACSWACEQALRCADVAAVLAWLPQARSADLRRLQLAAAQHENLLFVFRPEAQAHSASPARLRLRLRFAPTRDAAMAARGKEGAAPARIVAIGTRHGIAEDDDGAGDVNHAGRMDVDVLKRRGPPLASPLTLPARGERLAALLGAALQRQRRRQAPRRDAADEGTSVAAMAGPAGVRMPGFDGGPSDAVDRIAMAT